MTTLNAWLAKKDDNHPRPTRASKPTIRTRRKIMYGPYAIDVVSSSAPWHGAGFVRVTVHDSNARRGECPGCAGEERKWNITSWAEFETDINELKHILRTPRQADTSALVESWESLQLMLGRI